MYSLRKKGQNTTKKSQSCEITDKKIISIKKKRSKHNKKITKLCYNCEITDKKIIIELI